MQSANHTTPTSNVDPCCQESLTASFTLTRFLALPAGVQSLSLLLHALFDPVTLRRLQAISNNNKDGVSHCTLRLWALLTLSQPNHMRQISKYGWFMTSSIVLFVLFYAFNCISIMFNVMFLFLVLFI